MKAKTQAVKVSYPKYKWLRDLAKSRGCFIGRVLDEAIDLYISDDTRKRKAAQ